MFKFIAAMLMLGTLGANAGAQTISDAEFGGKISAILKQGRLAAKSVSRSVAQNQARQASVNRIEGVLTAMNDMPGTGAIIAQWLRQNNAVVEFMPARPRTRPLQPLILMDPALRAAPDAALGAAVARAAARAMLSDFPASPEKQYLLASRTAETYFELGGTRAGINALDEQTAADIRLWIENGVEPGVQLLTHEYNEPLPEQLRGLERDRQLSINCGMSLEMEFDERIARVEKAMQGFAQFQRQEADWLKSFSRLVK